MLDPQSQTNELTAEIGDLLTQVSEWRNRLDGFLGLSCWTPTALANSYETHLAKQGRTHTPDRRPLNSARLQRVMRGHERNQELLQELLAYAANNPRPGSLLAALKN